LLKKFTDDVQNVQVKQRNATQSNGGFKMVSKSETEHTRNLCGINRLLNIGNMDRPLQINFWDF